MNDAARIDLANATADRCALLARALDVIGVDGLTVIARIRDAQGPLHSRSYEAAGSSRPTGTPPPGTGRTDRAQHDERDLDACVTGAAQAINRAWSIIGNYPPAHAANATERAALGLGDGPWCASCARTEGPDGAPRREPIRSDLARPTDVAGRLPEPMWLCRWCYQCVIDWGRTPTPAEVERHHTHGRIPWPADVERPA